MNLRELIDELERCAESHGDDTEVRLAIQPTWPFEHSIEQVVIGNGDDDGEYRNIVYIAEGGQIGYLPGDVRKGLEWGR